MSEDTVLVWFRVFMPLTLIWILSPSTVKCQECSTSGLNVFDGYKYVFDHGTDGFYRTFSETRAFCQSLGGDMPIITSAEQNDFIAGKLITISDTGHYYIGLEDMDEDGVYRWIDGTAPGYTNWDNPLYTSISPPYCALMRSRLSHTDPKHGRWNRGPCLDKRRQICQIPIDVECRWQELGESQYLIKSTPRATPNDARETCQSYGGDLAIIETAKVNAFLKELLPPLNQSDPNLCYFFGLRRSGSGDFTWLDDTTLQYNDWYTATEPHYSGSWGCLGLRDGPSWYERTPQFLPYICERTRVYDRSSEASFGGLDYIISPSWLARSYSDARIYCQYHGADLALIKSHDINTFLHGKISGLNSPVFFGLTDQAEEGTFMWIDGTPIQYAAWRASEPNDEGDEDCATLSSDPDMGWLDSPCNLNRPFICERYQDVPEYKWSLLDGTLYYISQSSVTSYSFARKYCQAQGGDLAQPKTDKINLHLIELAGGNSYWFGLDDINQEGTFQWIDGSQLDNNGFPAWSNGDATLFENERCVHQQVNNGWRKLPCSSYLRLACEKTPSPRQILPVRLLAANPLPFGGGLPDASFICLLGPENEEILTFSTRRLVRLTESITPDSYTAPGDSDNVSSVLLRQTLPATMEGLGFFECSAVTARRISSVPLGILFSSRQLQPTDGRFTKTIQTGDDITLSVMSTIGMVQDDGIRWRKLSDGDWANSLIGMSSGSLSHTIHSASVSDAGVFVTYMDGTLEQHQFSLIRLIVKECPYGRWNPPLCDRLCDSCYNGGVCHELSGSCLCPPGHAGKNCLRACGMHKFGWDCEFECGPGQPLDKCAGSQICLPDPYGCTCLAGYTGIYCNETCIDGMFGADCLQECHCTDGADCDYVTGECPGDCSQGWSGSACQVPSVCQNGYFGTNCTQKCNCMNGTPCHKDSGYCDEVEGRCDLGYIYDYFGFPAYCMTFSGCFSSCSKTCHCSGGPEDCNFLTGDCLSSICHPRWMGDQCQTDRFATSLEKTNPGMAIFSCAFTASSGQNLPSDYVKAAAGRSFMEPWITRSSSDTSETTLNNSFIHEYTGPEEAIYCFVAVPESSSEFAFVRLPRRDFFVLPRYNGIPELLELGYYHATIGWRQWDPSSDTGDGPIVGYKIYVRSGSNVEVATEVQPPSMVTNTNRSISKRSAENATEMAMYNVKGLDAGSTYSVQIAAIRDGINGEGEQGAALTFTTRQGSTATVVGSFVGASVVIVIVIVLIIIFYKRRSVESASTKSKGKEFDSSPQYENPVFDQSKTDVHTYQVMNTDPHTYQDLSTDDLRTNVARKTIQPSTGGTIQLPDLGISLCIPALAMQKKCLITLKVLAQPSSVLFAENEVTVSPGVVCEPSGTTFASPLKLIIPHCAVLTDPSKAKVILYFTHGDTKVTKKELSSTGIPRCVVRKDDLDVYIDHFSICEMFMVISDSFIGKRVASTPYLPKSMSHLLPQYCRLRLYNDNPGLEDLIEKEENKLDYRKMASTQKMFVLWEKGELKIRCEVDSGHVTENEKTVSLDDLYRLDRKVVSFLVKATGNADVHFKFNFHPHCDEGHAFKAEFLDGGEPPILEVPSTTTSMEPEGATEPSESSERKEELPATPIRLDDILLYDIAEEIETDEHLERLMYILEVTRGSQLRYHEINRLEGRLTARGTRQMLMDWRARTAIIEQHDRLKDALTRAQLLDLRDRFFPG